MGWHLFVAAIDTGEVEVEVEVNKVLYINKTFFLVLCALRLISKQEFAVIVGPC